MRTRGFLVVVLVVLLGGAAAMAAELQFPALSGRVVDGAGLLSASEKSRLEEMLAGQEAAAGDQVVVVTVKSLQGVTIEEFGYQLGRHWGIGQKDANNGVLLIVAPNERKLRIEVGYGLEGKLTDATAKIIIETEIVPAFKAGRLGEGISRGARAIINVLGGKAPAPAGQLRETAGGSARDSGGRSGGDSGGDSGEDSGGDLAGSVFFWILALIIIVMLLKGGGGGFGGRRRGHGFGGRRGGFSGGGFSGGGGGFGGGGASGGW